MNEDDINLFPDDQFYTVRKIGRKLENGSIDIIQQFMKNGVWSEEKIACRLSEDSINKLYDMIK